MAKKRQRQPGGAGEGRAALLKKLNVNHTSDGASNQQRNDTRAALLKERQITDTEYFQANPGRRCRFRQVFPGEESMGTHVLVVRNPLGLLKHPIRLARDSTAGDLDTDRISKHAEKYFADMFKMGGMRGTIQ